MLDKNEKIELKDYFEGFTATEMADVIKIAREVESQKYEEEYNAALRDLVDKMDSFINKYGYLDIDIDGVISGIGASAILSADAIKENTICVRYLDERG